MTTPIKRDISERPGEYRIPPVEAADLTDAQRALAGLGASNVIRVLVRHDELLNAMNPIGTQLLTSQRTSMRDRELAILRVALRSGSPYEWANHVPAALAGDATEAEIRALTDPEAAWPDVDAALLRAVDELCADDGVSDATWAALHATRDDVQLIELLVLVGYYRLMAGVLNSVGVQTEPGRPGFGEVPDPAAGPSTTSVPPTGAPGAGGTPEGTWAVVFHHPAGDQNLTLVMATHDGRITGSVTNPASGIVADIADGTVDGPRFRCLTILTTPVRLEITYQGMVDGGKVSGQVAIVGAGEYPFDGVRA